MFSYINGSSRGSSNIYRSCWLRPNYNIDIIISFKHVRNKLKSISLKLFININNSDFNSTKWSNISHSQKIFLDHLPILQKRLFLIDSYVPHLKDFIMPLKKSDEHSETFQPYLHLKDFQLILVSLSLFFLITLSNHTLPASPQ